MSNLHVLPYLDTCGRAAWEPHTTYDGNLQFYAAQNWQGGYSSTPTSLTNVIFQPGAYSTDTKVYHTSDQVTMTRGRKYRVQFTLTLLGGMGLTTAPRVAIGTNFSDGQYAYCSIDESGLVTGILDPVQTNLDADTVGSLSVFLPLSGVNGISGAGFSVTNWTETRQKL